jgi:FkbM family methyltransferase
MTSEHFLHQLDTVFKALDDVGSSTPFWNDYPQVIIYGAGNFGKRVYKVLNRNGIRVLAFLDRKAEPGQLFNNIPIWQPTHGAIACDDLSKTCVIIAIHNRDCEVPPILDQLKACGFSRLVTPIELYDTLGNDLGDSYWLTARSWYKSFKKEIAGCFSLWDDQKSREIFLNTLKFRLSGNYSICPIPEELNSQYTPFDIPSYKWPLRFVDCGAFVGDTLKSLLDANVPFESVAAFEPDQRNFNELAKFVETNSHRLPNASLWPCGVYSSVMQARFETSKGEASKLSSEGEAVIQCVSLDRAIPNFAPNLIKMDVEGSECEAILGAQRIIKAHLPSLAICVYHDPKHLWEIPLLIKDLCNDNSRHYNYYLRTHGFNGFEQVMYAIPCPIS